MSQSIEERRKYQRDYYRKKKSQVGAYYREKRSQYYQEHKEEYAERSKSWYSKAENKLARRQREHQINFQIMFEIQSGLCALGGEPLPEDLSAIHVDHDHETGWIRGLLCRPHNVGLGMFNDDPELLIKAAEYIMRHKERIKSHG